MIRNLKAYYCRRFNLQLLDSLEKNQPDAAKINVLEAIQLAHAAWTLDVQPECIRNCFTNCKLRTSDMDNAANANVGVPQAVAADLQGQVQQLYRNPMSIGFLLNNSDEEQVSNTPTDAEVLESVQLPESARGSYSKEDDSVTAPPVPLRNTASMLAELKTFWL
uniref:DDE-1 domain-containing protein n=1 Tax=Hyaloperonospora arabidopsidis (strain Emoy2) TaxID=559515 RepID=M4B569_HYAAE